MKVYITWYKRLFGDENFEVRGSIPDLGKPLTPG